MTGISIVRLCPIVAFDSFYLRGRCFWRESRFLLWAGLGKDYIGVFIESVVDVFFDDAGFADGLVAKEDYFDLGFATHGAD